MKFSTREDIDAPMDYVFDALCNFDAFERAAMRHGAQVRRLVDPGQAQAGFRWGADFKLRGKARYVEIELTTFDRPSELQFESETKGLAASTKLELMPLSKSRTRIIVGLEIRPQSLSARLLIQSLKLAKASLTKRFRKRTGEVARKLEKRYRNGA